MLAAIISSKSKNNTVKNARRDSLTQKKSIKMPPRVHSMNNPNLINMFNRDNKDNVVNIKNMTNQLIHEEEYPVIRNISTQIYKEGKKIELNKPILYNYNDEGEDVTPSKVPESYKIEYRDSEVHNNLSCSESDMEMSHAYAAKHHNSTINILNSEPFFVQEKKKYGKKTKYIFEKTKYFKEISIKDTKYKELIYEKYRSNTLFQMIFAILTLLSSIIGVEMQSKRDNTNSQTTKDHIILHLQVTYIICSVSTLIELILCIADHFYFYDIVFQQKKISDEIIRSQSRPVIYLIILLILIIPHPNILFLDYYYTRYNEKFNVTVTYSYNSLFMVICLLRLYIILKFYLVNSTFYTPQSKRA